MALYKLALALVLFSLNFGYTNTSNNNTLNTVIQYDNNIINTEKLASLKTDDDYNYSVENYDTSLWAEFVEWFSNQLKKLFGEDYNPDSLWFNFLESLPYIILGLALILIVWFIAKMNPGNQVMRQHNNSRVILTDEEEELLKRNLEQLAEKSIEQKDYKLAIRYLYLNCIKRMDMKQIIRYMNDKTNFEYIREIKSDYPELSRRFRTITIIYEEVWYGQLVFDEEYFNNIIEKVDEFHKLLDQKDYAQA